MSMYQNESKYHSKYYKYQIIVTSITIKVMKQVLHHIKIVKPVLQNIKVL